MKRIGWWGTILGVLGVLGVFQPNVQAEQVIGAVAPGEYIVKFSSEVSDRQQDLLIAARGGVVAERIGELGIAITRFKQPKSDTAAHMAQLVQALESEELIEYAEPNWIVSAAQQPVVAQPGDPGEVSAAQARRRWLPLVQGRPIMLPNDPDTAQQWAWSKIGAYRAWGLSVGVPQVVIAIVDSGVDLQHPDLASKIVPGYDFVDLDNVPQDGQGHGTHVAGTAAGVTNNAVGIAGTCPGCSIMPVRVLDDKGNGSLYDVIEGIKFAADEGAQVINLSLSGPASKAEEDAVNYAWSKGAVLACAAGNDYTNNTSEAYPGAAPNCIAVAATDTNDAKPNYSNYGTWVDLAAPGSRIYSTSLNGGYTWLSGTSMATPHVAGAAGLLAGKGLNNAQIRAQLEATADKIAGTGVFWNAGRLNIQSALR